MTTGDRIKAARKAAGMTQEDLGEKLGLSSSFIAQYETNNRNPKIDTLKRIAAALGCDWVSLTEEDDPRVVPLIWDELRASLENKPTSDTSLLTRVEFAMNSLNPDGQQKAVERVEELTEIPRYRRQDAPQFEVPAPEGTDTTTPPNAPETPPEGE